jgi:hypothetical protein
VASTPLPPSSAGTPQTIVHHDNPLSVVVKPVTDLLSIIGCITAARRLGKWPSSRRCQRDKTVAAVWLQSIVAYDRRRYLTVDEHDPVQVTKIERIIIRPGDKIPRPPWDHVNLPQARLRLVKKSG